MITFDAYYYRDEDDPKLLVTLDWFFMEDNWRQRYFMDRPKYNEEVMEKLRLDNLNRCRYFKIVLNLFCYRMSVQVKLKKVGNVMHGRVMEDAPWSVKKRNRSK